jgi:drug/metabolite transporter (DMT)-like permease
VTEAAQPVGTRWNVIVPFAVVTLIWSSTWIVIRDQLGVVPDSWSVAYRFFVAGAALLVLAIVRREPLRLDGPGILFALGLGLAQFVLNFNFVYRAEHHVTSGLVALVFALLIVPNAVLSRIFLKQHLSGRFLIASAIAILGVALLFVQEARRDPGALDETLVGIGFTLLGVLAASTANVMQATKRATHYPMVPMLAWAMLMGAGLDAIWAWSTVGPPVMEWRLGYIAGVLYLGLAASALAFALYYRIIRVIGPAMAAYSSVIVPVIAMLLSTVFEGYRWSLLAAAGASLALIGLVVALRARRPVR